MSTISDPQTKELVAGTDPFRYGWRYVRKADEAGKTAWVRVPLTQEDVLHPQEEDFIVQTNAHQRDCQHLKNVLDEQLVGRPGMKVFHDMRTDWGVRGVTPHGPDFVVFEGMVGEWSPIRGTFMAAEVGARPVLVIEVTSPSTRDTDLDDKVVEYYKAGVPFYAIVDSRPGEEPRCVRLLGYRATPEGYVRVPLDERGWLWLDPVRIWLAGGGEKVVCYDEQGNRILEHVERVQAHRETAEALRLMDERVEEAHALTEDAVRARQAAESQAQQEAQARQAAEAQAADFAARLQAMEAELRRLRNQG
jgi:hypothetical protein